MRATDVDKGADWFTRYGPIAVLVGRCVPVVRSVVSIPAGVTKMPMRVFPAYSAIGIGVWNAIFVGAGYQLGTHWQHVEKYSGPLNSVVILVLAALLLFWVGSRVVNTAPTSGSSRSVSQKSRQPRPE